jgi:Flp pilus assembly protein TadG
MYRGDYLISIRTFCPAVRGNVAIMVALLLPALLGGAALATDVSIWLIEQHRLQIAADAGAVAGGLVLSNSTVQSSSPTSFATVVQNEIKAVTGNQLIGTVATPQVSVGSGYSSLTVTVTSVADSFFAAAVKFAAPSITVKSRSAPVLPPACVLALDPSKKEALDLGAGSGSGYIDAPTCTVFSDSSGTGTGAYGSNDCSVESVFLNTGKIVAGYFGLMGFPVCETTSSGNSITPAPSAAASSAIANPDAAIGYYDTSAPSSYSTCNTSLYNCYTGDVSGAVTTSASKPGFFYGSYVQFGANGTTATFAPGLYYVNTQSGLEFRNFTTNLSGVTFVISPTSSGATTANSFVIDESSTFTMTAPTSSSNGGITGYLIYAPCPAGDVPGSSITNPTVVNFGGSGNAAVTASGAIYAPCTAVNIIDGSSVTAVSGSNLSVVADTIQIQQGPSTSSPTLTAAVTGTNPNHLIALTE